MEIEDGVWQHQSAKPAALLAPKLFLRHIDLDHHRRQTGRFNPTLSIQLNKSGLRLWPACAEDSAGGIFEVSLVNLTN